MNNNNSTCKNTTEELKSKEDFVYKYSNRGLGQLKESGIIAGNSCFIKLHEDIDKDKCFIQWEPRLEDMKLRPPTRQEYPYEPYEFKTAEEPQMYLQRAMKETPDTLLAKIKAMVKQFNAVSDKTATLLSAYIFGSYFQYRFSTVHYIEIVGANGTGKSVFGDTFECLGYSAVNVTNTTESFWFWIFGTYEYGQVTLVIEEFDKMEENTQIMAMIKQGYQPFAKVPRMNADLTKMEFYYPFGDKIMIAEKSPNEDKARGVLDRSFKNMTYKGSPTYSIKEIRNPQGQSGKAKNIQ